MKRTFVKVGLLAVVMAVAGAAQAITVTWGAYTDFGIATSTGTPVPVGSLVLIGSFGALTNAQISSASLATLQANFINFADTSGTVRHMGDGAVFSGGTTPTAADAGVWNDTNTNSSLTLGIATRPVYYWVFNGTTIANSTQEGIFTASFDGASPAIRANWTFKNDTDIPPTQTTDLDQVLPYTTGRTGTVIDRNAILIGNYGTGTVGGNPAYNLAPIPEPSTISLLIGTVGLAGLLAWKRQIQSVA